MLNQIFVTRTIFLHIENQLADDIQLMEAQEDELLLRDIDGLAVLLCLLRGDLVTDELLQDIHHTVLPQDVPLEICGNIVVVGCLWVASTAITPRTIAALVERQ